jgi:hypothetical protein
LLVLQWRWIITVLPTACISSYWRGRCKAMLNVSCYWVLLNGKERRRCIRMRLVVMLCCRRVAYSWLGLRCDVLA